MTIHKKYLSIPNFYAARRVLDLSQVLIEEKVDGTNFSFGNLGDKLVMNSRNHMMWKWSTRDSAESHVPQFDGFGAVAKFKELFPNVFGKIQELGRFLIFGEFYGAGIQKRLNYCGQEKRFIFFDVFDVENDRWLPMAEFSEVCEKLELPTVPVLYTGPPDNSVFEELVKKKSVVAASNGIDSALEGIIIKGLNADLDHHGERIIAKYKSEEFAEISLTQKELANVRKKKGETAGLDFARAISRKYVTESRLENCLEKFRSESKGMTIKIIPEVIKYMTEDVLKDLAEEDRVDNLFELKLVQKSVSAESAILFKEWLKSNGN